MVGGGIAGLTAAFHLKRRGVGVRLLEATDRLGGTLATRRRDGFLLEGGPDSFLTSKPAGIALAEALGLSDTLIGINPDLRRSFVLSRGRLVPVPEGFYLLAPASLGALVRTPLFSWAGKVRMALEPLIPARRDGVDESLAAFVRRRLGREALERFAQPMAGGIYTADPERLSLAATLPQFQEMERTHGSVLKGLRHLPRGTSGPRYGLFATFRDGMQTLADALVSRLDGACRTSSSVAALSGPGPWRLTLASGEVLETDALCLAPGAPGMVRLLEDVDPVLSAELVGIPCADSATLNLAFRRDQVAHPLDGMGFVVPAVEGMNLLSCSFSSRKFPGRAPEGSVLLRAFIGGALQPDRYALSDAALVAAVLDDLRRILGIQGEPLFAELARHPRAMPQYHLGHLERVARVEARMPALPGLALAGNAFRGPGIPDCIASGERAASSLAGLFGGS